VSIGFISILICFAFIVYTTTFITSEVDIDFKKLSFEIIGTGGVGICITGSIGS